MASDLWVKEATQDRDALKVIHINVHVNPSFYEMSDSAKGIGP